MKLSDRQAIGILKIGKPNLSCVGGKARVTAKIIIEGSSKDLWFEVEQEYGKYLCYERGDAFLIGLLWIALVRHYDIKFETPVTGELLHQIETVLIPSLVKNSRVMRAPKITCSVENEPLSNAGAVGTGMSCGVDSFHTVANYYDHPIPNLRLTHLAVYNVGAFGLYDIATADPQFRWQVENSRRVADELGLKLVVGNSNLKNEFFTDFRYTHTYANMFAVFMLQKLWGVYFYSSAGWDMSEFDVCNADRNDSAHYDLLTFYCLGTKHLRVYSEGASRTRFEKMNAIIGLPYARKCLQVCCRDGGKNCGRCFKCKRTLVCLDALGAIDQFDDVFDIAFYKANRSQYLGWLAAQKYGNTEEFKMEREVWQILQGGIPWRCHIAGVFLGAKERIKAIAKNSLFVYQFYRRLRGRG